MDNKFTPNENNLRNIQELIDQYKFKSNKIWYKITKEYDNKYNRFTVIGRI